MIKLGVLERKSVMEVDGGGVERGIFFTLIVIERLTIISAQDFGVAVKGNSFCLVSKFVDFSLTPKNHSHCSPASTLLSIVV